MRQIRLAAALSLSLAAALVALPALAGIRDPGVNRRQHAEMLRIHQGATGGALTRPELQRLAAEQRSIRLEERAYKSDGFLSRRERADLARDQNIASRHIWIEKHDAQRRR
jgi:hypothetical protein